MFSGRHRMTRTTDMSSPHPGFRDCRVQSHLGSSIQKAQKYSSPPSPHWTQTLAKPLITLGTKKLTTTHSLTSESWEALVYYVCSVLSHSVVSNSFRPQTIAHQAPLSMGFSRKEYWSGLPFPTPRDLPNSGIRPASVLHPCLGRQIFTTEPPGGAPCRFIYGILTHLQTHQAGPTGRRKHLGQSQGPSLCRTSLGHLSGTSITRYLVMSSLVENPSISFFETQYWVNTPKFLWEKFWPQLSRKGCLFATYTPLFLLLNFCYLEVALFSLMRICQLRLKVSHRLTDLTSCCCF